MKVSLKDLRGKEIESLELPSVFNTPFRPEIIKKVYVNVLSTKFQPQGRYPAAGEIVSAESRNTGQGIARIARARGEGFQRAGQAAGVAGVRSGRLTHPPVSWKKNYKKINKKEKQLGFCSAIAATSNKDIIEKRGHNIGKISAFPILVANDLEKITKTAELRKTLLSLGLEDDLKRSTNIVRVPSGKSRLRGRKKHAALSCLIVVSKDSPVSKLKKSLPGVSVVSIENLSIMDLVPGTKPVRLTIYTKNAIDSMNKINTVWSKIQTMVK
ncbi:MAG TPA: 50S ribosomal protein L4 [Nitrososphaeraceae archaeon]|jgi:large subunit ribosomal protein L4e|nr:50S ribosomal protein L4 [Nitrososphaeraceae archaeon]